MNSPFSWLAARYSTQRRSLRAAALSSLVASVLIIVGGGIVRVTGSGLGCPDWPACGEGSLGPTAEMGIHGIIEFANRLITVVLCFIVGWVILAARLQRQPVPTITRWAWAQFWVVVLNGVVGGITVWVKLNPYVVAAHFLAATLLLTAAAITWDKVQNLNLPAAGPASQKTTNLANATLAATAVLVVLGTVATGTGPHAGDSADVARMPFSWAWVTSIHSMAAICALVLTFMLRHSARERGEHTVLKRTNMFIIIFFAQGLIGVFQSLTHLPEVAVVLHLIGSALVWVGVVRIRLAARGSDSDFVKPKLNAPTSVV